MTLTSRMSGIKQGVHSHGDSEAPTREITFSHKHATYTYPYITYHHITTESRGKSNWDPRYLMPRPVNKDTQYKQNNKVKKKTKTK